VDAYINSGSTEMYGPIEDWNTSLVTDMSRVFRDKSSFNANISAWQVGEVTNMAQMFLYAYAFNGDLSAWQVGEVTDMYAMFWSAGAFNGNLSTWEVGKVTNMNGMFAFAGAFNGDLSTWKVGKVMNMGDSTCTLFLFSLLFLCRTDIFLNNPLSSFFSTHFYHIGLLFFVGAVVQCFVKLVPSMVISPPGRSGK
jgi:surface protein